MPRTLKLAQNLKHNPLCVHVNAYSVYSILCHSILRRPKALQNSSSFSSASSTSARESEYCRRSTDARTNRDQLDPTFIGMRPMPNGMLSSSILHFLYWVLPVVGWYVSKKKTVFRVATKSGEGLVLERKSDPHENVEVEEQKDQ